MVVLLYRSLLIKVLRGIDGSKGESLGFVNLELYVSDMDFPFVRPFAIAKSEAHLVVLFWE